MTAHVVVRDSLNSLDLRFEVDLSSTVRDLKERVAEAHPSKPPATTQKLVFAGRLFNDTQNIRDSLGFVSAAAALTRLARRDATFLGSPHAHLLPPVLHDACSNMRQQTPSATTSCSWSRRPSSC